MKVVVIGSLGLLGKELVKTLKNKGFQVLEADLPNYDLICYNSIGKLFWDNKDIDCVINCAAYTDVSGAEKESEKTKVHCINVNGVLTLGQLCFSQNIKLIHFSTDFVFDGTSEIPYKENDIKNPLNFYGKSKLMGEEILLKGFSGVNNLFTIFRLQWLFGNNPKTFFNKILKKAYLGDELDIVEDEFGSPCSVAFVSNVVTNFLLKNKKFKNEVFHLTHDDYCSRYECAKYFLDKMGYFKIHPIYNAVMDVARPKFGVMNNTKLKKCLKSSLGSWKEDIDAFAKELRNAK